MVLASREDAQFLSDAVQGDGDPLSVLQEFERSPRPTLEELKPFEYEILSHQIPVLVKSICRTGSASNRLGFEL